MNASAFDTLAYSRRMEQAGFTPPQAAALARLSSATAVGCLRTEMLKWILGGAPVLQTRAVLGTVLYLSTLLTR